MSLVTDVLIPGAAYEPKPGIKAWNNEDGTEYWVFLEEPKQLALTVDPVHPVVWTWQLDMLAEQVLRYKIEYVFPIELGERYISPYGVCDTPEQAIEYLRPLWDVPDRKFVINLAPIKKSKQPEQWGWRWHKWGPYIGEGTPTHEYLYDEPEFEEVLIFHLSEAVDKPEGGM